MPSHRCRFVPRVTALEERLTPFNGAEMVADLSPGIAGTSITEITPAGGLTYFVRATPAEGTELWVTAGTPTTTKLVRDIRVGSNGSQPRDLTAVGNVLYFTADDGTRGREVWRSEGQSGNTRMVADIKGTFDGVNRSSNPRELTVGPAGSLYFSADHNSQGRELFRTTPAMTTAALINVQPGSASSSPEQLTMWGDRLAFAATSVAGQELWSYSTADSAAGRIADIAPGKFDSRPRNLTSAGGNLFFTADDGLSGRALYLHNGTTANLVKDVLASNNDQGPFPEMVAVQSGSNWTLFFEAGDTLWRSDGTRDGTVKQPRSATESRPINPFGLSVVYTTVYFGNENDGLLRSLKAPFTTIVSEGTRYSPGGMVEGGSLASGFRGYFVGTTSELGTEPYVVTPGSAPRVIDIRRGTNGSAPTQFVSSGSEVYFTANNGVNGVELWRVINNTPPSISAIANQSHDEGTNINVSVSYSDPNRQILSATVTGLPPGLSFNATTRRITGTPLASAGKLAPYAVTMEVSDGVTTTSRSFNWTVRDRTTPTINNPGTQVDTEGNFVRLYVTVEEPSGSPDAITYTHQNLPQGLSLRKTTEGFVIEGTLGNQSSGTRTVIVTADSGSSATASFTWVVQEAAVVLIDPGSLENTAGQEIEVHLQVINDGDPLTFSATGLPPGLSIVAATGVIRGRIAANAVGSYTPTVTVTDGTFTVSVTFDWTIFAA